MIFLMAIRNLLRSRERTLLSLLMIASSMAGLVLFRGFTDDTLRVIQDISTEMHFGHMQFAKKKYWNNEFENMSDRLLDLDSEVLRELEKIDGVRSVSGRIHSMGILSYDVKTENTSLMAFDILKEPGIKNALKIVDGNYFSDAFENEILVGHMLGNKMGIKPGQTITLVTNTVDGVINAKEFFVRGFFASGTEEIDRYYSYVPLAALQEVLQTQSVDLYSIKLTQDQELSRVQAQVQDKLNNTQKDIQVRDWVDLSELFRKVKVFYDMQNLIIRFILVTIVFLGILNTMSMSVIERIGEIGTIKALGSENSFIGKMFFCETLILGFVGILFGSIVAIIFGNFVNQAQIFTEVPGASLPMQVKFLFSAEGFVESGLYIVCATIVAFIVPLYQALKIPIVEALRRNI